MASAILRGLCCAALLLMCCLSRCLAVDYTVGDSSGWTTNYDYSAWTSGKTFAVGDTLKFNYAQGAHNVAEVSSGDYGSCSSANTISDVDNSGATAITLKAAGTHYFICGVPGHCAGGMKLAVTVGGGATPSTPSTPAPPNIATPTSPAASTGPPSSSGKLVPPAAVALVGLALLMKCAALF